MRPPVQPDISASPDAPIVFSVGDGESAVVVPPEARTFEGCRAWARSVELPRGAKIAFVNNELRIDMSPENLETHNLVKGEIASALLALVRKERRGVLYFDGCLLSVERIGLATVPDAVYVSKASFASDKVKRVASKHDQETHAELLGAPDWVLEVVSPTSERKDKVVLRQAYYEAGVGEYWLVDARRGQIGLQVLVPGDQGFEEAEKQDGWQTSPTFGRSFRLNRESEPDGFGYWELRAK